MIRISLLCLVLVGSSCASLSIEDSNVISRPFSSVDSSSDIVLATNQTFEIVLPSNPTTGYSWSLHIDQPLVVRTISDQYVADSSGRVGVGGNTTWLLDTGNSGTAALTFSYNRSWEKEIPPSRVVVFTIDVR